MAVTAAVVASTPTRATFLVTHDGAAGDALTITAAQLAAAAQPGMLRTFLSTQWAGNNQANARLRLLGQGAATLMGTMGTAIQNNDHCRCFVRHVAGLFTAVPVVDADVDAVDALQNEINISTSGGVAASFLLDVEYQHTYTR